MVMNNVVIRPAQDSDAVGMALMVVRGQSPLLADMPQLHLELPAGAVAYCGALETHPQGRIWIQELATWWQKQLASPRWRIVVLTRGRAVVGVAALDKQHYYESDGSRSARTREISYLEVAEDLQTEAIYQRILHFLLPDYSAGQIWVSAQEKTLEKAGERLGFVYDGTKKDTPIRRHRLVR